MEKDNNTISSSPSPPPIDDTTDAEPSFAPTLATPIPANPAPEETSKIPVEPEPIEITEIKREIPSEKTTPASIAETELPKPGEPAPNAEVEEKIIKDTPPAKILKEELETKSPKPLKPIPAPKSYNFKKEFRSKLRNLLQIANQKRSETIEENLKKIYEYARETEKITNDDVERLTGVSDRQALRYLKILVKRGKLSRFGTRKNICYKPILK